MEQQSFILLLDQYLSGNISPENEQILLEMLEEPQYRAALESRLTADLKAHTREQEGMEDVRIRLQANLAHHLEQEQKKRRRIPVPIRWAAAAVLLTAVATGVFYLHHPGKAQDVAQSAKPAINPKVLPGSTRATLTLASGATLILDSMHTGLIASQGNAHIQKLGNGELSYMPSITNAGKQDAMQPAANPDAPEKNKDIANNTLTTPKGGWYQLRLSDGTKVWLNSVSSLTFPVSFAGPVREVTLEGEAYFEVEHAKDRPFKVHIRSSSRQGDMSVLVLGTSFNINAYSDEDAVRTTLVAGAVKVARDKQEALLRPGQQARISEKDSRFSIAQAPMDEVLAWKNGEFYFDSTDIRTIMRQIARWYDVQIVYADANMEDIRFSGSIARKENVGELLELLELLQLDGRLKLRLDGRRILVTRSRG